MPLNNFQRMYFMHMKYNFPLNYKICSDLDAKDYIIKASFV